MMQHSSHAIMHTQAAHKSRPSVSTVHKVGILDLRVLLQNAEIYWCRFPKILSSIPPSTYFMEDAITGVLPLCVND
jgi:hypothetical protein